MEVPNSPGVKLTDLSPTQARGRPLAPRYSRSIVLYCSPGSEAHVERLLPQFVIDGVQYLHLAGPDGAKVRQRIDQVLTKGGFKSPINATWYEGETLESVVAFAESYCRHIPSGTQVMHL